MPVNAHDAPADRASTAHAIPAFDRARDAGVAGAYRAPLPQSRAAHNIGDRGSSIEAAALYRELVEQLEVAYEFEQAARDYWTTFVMPLLGCGDHTSQQPLPEHEDCPQAQSPTERFMADWVQGALPIPLQVCTAQQLYRAFLHCWIELGGGRCHPSQRSFTRSATQWVREAAEQRVQYKIVSLDSRVQPRHACRCWWPAEARPPDGMTEGTWGFTQVSTFEDALLAYTPSPGVRA